MKKIPLLLVVSFFLLSGHLCASGSVSDKQKKISALVEMALLNENKKGHTLYMISEQRALTQKMAKEALLVALGIDVPQNKAYLERSVKRYGRILRALLNGDRELRISPAKNPEIRKFIRELQKEWRKFYAHIKNIYEKESVSKEDLSYVITHNENLLRDTNRLFLMYKKEDNFDNKLTESMMNALDFAGRESMLSQKIVKEKLLILSGINVEENKSKLRGSFILFDRALRGLLNGNEKRGLSPASVSYIRAELLKIESIWLNIIPVLFKENMEKEDLQKLVSLNIPLLQGSNRVLKMYEDLADLY